MTGMVDMSFCFGVFLRLLYIFLLLVQNNPRCGTSQMHFKSHLCDGLFEEGYIELPVAKMNFA